MGGLRRSLGYAVAVPPVPFMCVQCLSRSGGRLGLSPECRDKQWLGPCSSRPGAAFMHHRGAQERKEPGAGVEGASAAAETCCVKNKLSK